MNALSAGSGGMTVLTPEGIEQIIKAAKTILLETGTRFLDGRSLDIMKTLGAKVDATGLVKIPADLVDRALASAPRPVTIYDREGREALVLGGRNIYFGSLTNGFQYLDPNTKQTVPLGKAHEAVMVRLTDALPNLDYAMNSGTLCDCGHPFPGAEALAIVAENTTKPIGFTTNDFDNCREAVAVAAALAGGEEALAAKPFVIHYAEPISPLVHSADSCRKVMFLAEKSVPLTYTPYIMMGGTGPMSFASALALAHAEMFAGLVLHQGVRPGAPFIMGAMPSYLEMRHSIGVMGAPELHLLVAASAEVARHLDLPFFGTAGCSDAATVDLQAAAEAAMSIMSSLLSPANLVHDLGLMGHGESTSPEMLVLCDELIGMLAPFRRGIDVSEKTLATEVINQVGPGGHFLTHRHTLANFRLLSFSRLMDRSRTFLGTTLGQRLKAETLRLIETHQPRPLSPEKAALLAAFREKWRRAERR